MKLDIIKPTSAPVEGGNGHWTWKQDEDSGAFIQVWVSDDLSIPGGRELKNVRCRAKAAMTGSIRSAERFGTEYLNEEWVKIDMPFNADVSLRDKVTNIRTLDGRTLWSEEESNGNVPTTFDVFRISPDVDGFGNPIGKIVLVKRAVVQ